MNRPSRLFFLFFFEKKERCVNTWEEMTNRRATATTVGSRSDSFEYRILAPRKHLANKTMAGEMCCWTSSTTGGKYAK